MKTTKKALVLKRKIHFSYQKTNTNKFFGSTDPTTSTATTSSGIF